jgi:hypothetical protein
MLFNTRKRLELDTFYFGVELSTEVFGQLWLEAENPPLSASKSEFLSVFGKFRISERLENSVQPRFRIFRVSVFRHEQEFGTRGTFLKITLRATTGS